MAKRFGRTVINDKVAREWRYEQACTGSDHADLSGNCQNPPMVSMTGMADGLLARLGKASNDPVHVDIAVRCRKCPACLKARSTHWRMRAQNECAFASRTWFGTLTFAPANQFRITSLARSQARATALDFDRLTEQDQLAWRHRIASAILTRYIKRVRKESGAQLRYLLVLEAHKSGLPHYHCLLHESITPVRHAALTRQWHEGFSNWKLVDARAASYICKYLSKSALARVRASQNYGDAVAVVSARYSELTPPPS